MFEGMEQQFSVSLPSHAIYVRGDRARLIQVFSNILTNANKYTPAGGQIRVELEQGAGEAVVRIRDTGIGIPAGMLEEVFQLFAQVDRSSQRTRGGLGIGLAVTKRLIELHGGRIEAHSAGEGLGSEFVIRLPQSDAPPASKLPAQRRSPHAPRCRILVADDNQDTATSLSMLLELMGHQTRTVHDGLAAVAAVEAFQPDVVILDIGMPKLDGYEAARRIASLPRAKDLLLIAMTGWGQDADRERVREAGFHHHLVKPVDTDRLEELIERTRA
jgi:CheY-like chemotaxis protein